MRRNRPEDGLQEACAEYCDLMGWRWCHVANERVATAAGHAKFARLGVKSGVPDVLIFERWYQSAPGTLEDTAGPGLAIELKIKPNTPTANQRDWLAALKRRGWKTAVCYSLDEFIEATACLRRG